jgi:hypothetical protein
LYLAGVLELQDRLAVPELTTLPGVIALHVSPEGIASVRTTVPVNPFTGDMVIVDVAVFPLSTDAGVVAVIVKLGVEYELEKIFVASTRTCVYKTKPARGPRIERKTRTLASRIMPLISSQTYSCLDVVSPNGVGVGMVKLETLTVLDSPRYDIEIVRLIKGARGFVQIGFG